MNLFKELKDSFQRIYAIGDIHGCSTELGVLIDYLEKEEKISDQDLVVFLGDYLDRGQDSAGVIETLINFKEKYKNSYFLKGNHEASFIDYLNLGGEAGAVFFYNGGVQLFRSYGFNSIFSHEEISALVPQNHLEFLNSLELGIFNEEYIFVHAGVKPNIALKDQEAMDLMWIRDEFLEFDGKFLVEDSPRTVVFGHTPLPEVFYQKNRKIGLDTGLVYGNKLSCIELNSKDVLQVKRWGKEIERTNLVTV